LLARVSGDGLELYCLTGLHVFQRNLIIPQFSDVRDSVELFLRSGTRPGGVLGEHFAAVAQIEDTSQIQLFIGTLWANHSEALIQNTRESTANQSVTNSFANHLAITKHCISPNMLMVPILVAAAVTSELHFLYLWYAEYRLTCVLNAEVFRLSFQ
jgi:hypothetical protein